MINRLRLLPTALICASFIGTALSASDHRDAPYTQLNPMADIGDSFLFEGFVLAGHIIAHDHRWRLFQCATLVRVNRLFTFHKRD